jgi:DNA-binding NarL/FixJ family response regulator
MTGIAQTLATSAARQYLFRQYTSRDTGRRRDDGVEKNREEQRMTADKTMAEHGRKIYQILIVDDHPVVRYGLSQAIGKQADLAVCGEASTVAEALRLVEHAAPDVAIIDISLEDDSGLRLVQQIKTQHPQTKTLVSSIHQETIYAPRALRAGAMGYIEKGETLDKIVEAVRQILRDELYLSPQMGSRLLQRAAVGKPLEDDPSEMLSNRELQVFEMLGMGMTVNEIARRLGVSPKTVESHRKNIRTKLNLKNSAQLTHCAISWVQEQH